MAAWVTLVCVTGLWGCLLTSEWVRMGQRAGHGYKTLRHAPRGLLSPDCPPLTFPQSPKPMPAAGERVFQIWDSVGDTSCSNLAGDSLELTPGSLMISHLKCLGAAEESQVSDLGTIYIYILTHLGYRTHFNTRFLSVSYSPLKLFSFQRSICFMYEYECLACVNVYIPPVCWCLQKL